MRSKVVGEGSVKYLSKSVSGRKVVFLNLDSTCKRTWYTKDCTKSPFSQTENLTDQFDKEYLQRCTKYQMSSGK